MGVFNVLGLFRTEEFMLFSLTSTSSFVKEKVWKKTEKKRKGRSVYRWNKKILLRRNAAVQCVLTLMLEFLLEIQTWTGH